MTVHSRGSAALFRSVCSGTDPYQRSTRPASSTLHPTPATTDNRPPLHHSLALTRARSTGRTALCSSVEPHAEHDESLQCAIIPLHDSADYSVGREPAAIAAACSASAARKAQTDELTAAHLPQTRTGASDTPRHDATHSQPHSHSPHCDCDRERGAHSSHRAILPSQPAQSDCPTAT